MKKILIVEDETIISFGYRLQLEQLGFEVMDAVRSADEAEEALRRERPDVIIMDVYLKGDRNGLDVAREIQRTSAIPIIFLTASSKPEIVEGIRALPDCHYLVKPVDPDALSQVLNRIVTRHVR
jgi:two-component system, response regulator PdtaR